MSQPVESAQMFTILDHPLVGMKMTTLRDQRTPPQQSRQTLHEIAGLMRFHVFAHLCCDALDVHTPLERRADKLCKALSLPFYPFYVQETGCLTRCQHAHPDIPIITAAFDRQLDKNSYILPSLGDGGNRTYNRV